MKTSDQRPKNKTPKIHLDALSMIEPDAAGIDIAHREHWCAVPVDRCERPVQAFGTFTEDLEKMADWLAECGIKTVAMESTGVYWIPAFQILERRGFKVCLVNARHVKNVSGRKSDVLDCQWIQRLHSYGLLRDSFRPEDQMCVLRSFLRYRDELVSARSGHCQHMQKALQQMNVQLHQVLSDVTGVSGRRMIAAILAGERDVQKLAELVDCRVRASQATVCKALRGDFRVEHLFLLQCAYDLHQICEEKIALCDQQIVAQLAQLPNRVNLQEKPVPQRKPGRSARMDKVAGKDLREELYRCTGVDLTAIEGIGVLTAQVVITEIGLDMSRWRTEKHFASWLGLCPDQRISGGKVLSSRTRRVINPVADALRIAATTLHKSQTALGAYFRRMKGRLGTPSAITATAHKLARLIYRLIKHGELYVRQGLEEYEEKHRQRVLKHLHKTARNLGFQLTPNTPAVSVVS
jgi:transposase